MRDTTRVGELGAMALSPSLAFGHPSPAASHAREGVDKARCGVGEDGRRGEGFLSAPLPGLRPSLPRGWRTRGRD